CLEPASNHNANRVLESRGETQAVNSLSMRSSKFVLVVLLTSLLFAGVANAQAAATPDGNVVSITSVGGNIVVVFAGIPGDSYQAQYADTLDGGSWTNAGSPMIAGANGHFQYTEINPPAASRFYRAIALRGIVPLIGDPPSMP